MTRKIISSWLLLKKVWR